MHACTRDNGLELPDALNWALGEGAVAGGVRAVDPLSVWPFLLRADRADDISRGMEDVGIKSISPSWCLRTAVRCQQCSLKLADVVLAFRNPAPHICCTYSIHAWGNASDMPEQYNMRYIRLR